MRKEVKFGIITGVIEIIIGIIMLYSFFSWLVTITPSSKTTGSQFWSIIFLTSLAILATSTIIFNGNFSF